MENMVKQEFARSASLPLFYSYLTVIWEYSPDSCIVTLSDEARKMLNLKSPSLGWTDTTRRNLSKFIHPSFNKIQTFTFQVHSCGSLSPF